MRALGITRCVDNLGRIVIPKELRKSLNIQEGTPMEILANDDGIFLRKYSVGCAECQSIEDLVELGGVKVCRKCVEKVMGVA